MAPTVDRHSPLPLWAQVLADLRTRMAAGEFEGGFPTDEELRAHYGVSRQTVREAARRLQDEGVIVRSRGRRSELAESVLEQPLHAFYNLAETAQAHGYAERSEVRAVRTARAGAVAGTLGVEPDDEVVYLERLRFVGDEPFSVHHSWLPAHLARGLLDVDLRSGSLYDALVSCCGVRVTGGWERIRPEVHDASTAELLQLPDGVAVLVLERLALAADMPVEWRHSVVRGDRYSFRADWTPA